MLLELLSDFQISIPELGRIEAKTRPVVLLTSNNTRELTEALKRRCLYLWLDYPDLEHELEIVRLHAPELDQTVARKLTEIIHQIRQLDLKKPPSIAESIDWARTLLLLGRQRHRPRHVHRDDERDRQAPHRPRHGGGPRRCDARAAAAAGRRPPECRLNPGAAKSAIYGGIPERRPRRPRRPAARVRRGPPNRRGRDRHLRDPRRVRGAEPRRMDRPARLQGGAGDHPRQVQRRPKSVRARVRPLLLPRHRGPGCAARASPRPTQEVGRPETSTSTRSASRSRLRSGTARTPRSGTWPGWRSPRSAAARASGVLGVDVQRIRRALGLRTEPQPDLPDRRPPPRRPPPRSAPQVRAAPQTRARAQPDRAHREPPAQAPAQRTRPHPPVRPDSGPRRRPPSRRPAQAKARHPGPRAQGPQAPRPRRLPQDDARLAPVRRRPDRPQIPPQTTEKTRDLRALRRLHQRHQRKHLLPVRPPRPPRRVPQAPELRVHRADLGGDRGVRAGARLPCRQRGDLEGRRRRRRVRLHRLRPRLARVSGI